GVGMRIELDKVPMRQKDMKAWELLLSESQERMLIIVKKGREAEVLEIFDKWDLPCSEIGKVTSDKFLKFYMHGTLEAELPAESLVLGGGAPVYEREYQEPAYFKKINQFDQTLVPEPENLVEIARQIISLPNIASKRWVYNQYDSMVGTGNLVTNAPSDAAVVKVKGTKKALAITTDCNSRYVFADPYVGAMIAVSEASRNIVCSGGVPIGITNCLNFGNPYDPGVYYQFVQVIKGMSEACLKFETPVTGGNVSFYNQSPDGPVYPTPTIGMVGLLENLDNKMTLSFKKEGDVIFLLGKANNDINSSEYVHKILAIEYSPAPYFNLAEEFRVQQTVRALIENKMISSAHDISEGGLFVTLCESAFTANLGFDVVCGKAIRQDAWWFGEGQGRIVVSCDISEAEKLEAFLKTSETAFEKLGLVTKSELLVEGKNWGNIVEWKNLYDTAIENILKAAAEKGEGLLL
ncbi:MAG: AIR synthase-related protein, partial [Chitinophagaceae bacterium]